MCCMVSWTVLGVDCNLRIDGVDDAKLQNADENNNSLIRNAVCHLFFLPVCTARLSYLNEFFFSDV